MKDNVVIDKSFVLALKNVKYFHRVSNKVTFSKMRIIF